MQELRLKAKTVQKIIIIIIIFLDKDTRKFLHMGVVGLGCHNIMVKEIDNLKKYLGLRMWDVKDTIVPEIIRALYDRT